MTRRTILWGFVALLGIAATATLAWTASQIAGQRIGLSSEPLSIASGLAPSSATSGHAHPDQRHALPRRPTGRRKLRTTPAMSAARTPTAVGAPTTAAPTATAAPAAAAPASASPPVTATPSAQPARTSSQSSGGHDDNGGGPSAGATGASSAGASGASYSGASGGSASVGSGGSSGGGHRDD